jgi:hypothetical protein
MQLAIDRAAISNEAHDSFTTTDSACAQCGGELRRSRLLPHGEDVDGIVYLARFCQDEGLMFGRAVDGSWSVPVTGMILT